MEEEDENKITFVTSTNGQIDLFPQLQKLENVVLFLSELDIDTNYSEKQLVAGAYDIVNDILER